MTVDRVYTHIHMHDCMIKVLDIEEVPAENLIQVTAIWMTKSGSRFLETDTFKIKMEDLTKWREVPWVTL